MKCINYLDEIPENAVFCHLRGEKRGNGNIENQINTTEDKLGITDFSFNTNIKRDYDGHLNKILYLYFDEDTDYSKKFKDLFWKLKKLSDKRKSLDKVKELIKIGEVDN